MSAPTTQYGKGLYNYTNVTYFAPLSQNGIGTWTRTENYPINATDMDCTQLYETIYCVGGFITNKTSNSTYNINNTFYAHINPNGGKLGSMAKLPIIVPDDLMYRLEDFHLMINHALVYAFKHSE